LTTLYSHSSNISGNTYLLQHFWKYISNFRKQRSSSIQINVNGTYFIEPTAVADAFAKHFQSVYNNCDPLDSPPLSHSSGFLSLAPISDAHVCKASKRLHDIPSFITKGCSEICIHIFMHIFNLSMTQQCFPTAWQEDAVVAVFERGNHAAVNNYRAISILCTNRLSSQYGLMVFNFGVVPAKATEISYKDSRIE
jgi:hypothetical protein